MDKFNEVIKKIEDKFDFSKEYDFKNDECFKHLYFGLCVYKKDNPFHSIYRYSDLDMNALEEVLEKLEIEENEYAILSQKLKVNHPAIDEEYIELYYLHKSNKKIEDEVDYLIYKYHKSGDKNILKTLKKKIIYLDIE